MNKHYLGVVQALVIGLLVQGAWAQVGLTITGNFNPTRAYPVSYVAQSDPPGLSIDQFNWTYSRTDFSNSYQDNDSDGDDKSIWYGRMVVDGTLTCSAVVSGVSVSKSMSITVSPRLWTVPMTCVEDNDPDWGNEPTPLDELSRSRDRDSDMLDVFVPRNGDNWNAAFMVGFVDRGPCLGWYYVSSSILKCQRETVINRYLKSGGPTLGGSSFFQINTDRSCLSPSASDFVAALMNHEYRGTPPTPKSMEGHFGRMEKCILDYNHDAKKNIEPLVARKSEADLRALVNDSVWGDEVAVSSFERDETYPQARGSNWGSDPDSLGYGLNSRWNPDTLSWTDCINPFGDF